MKEELSLPCGGRGGNLNPPVRIADQARAERFAFAVAASLARSLQVPTLDRSGFDTHFHPWQGKAGQVGRAGQARLVFAFRFFTPFAFVVVHRSRVVHSRRRRNGEAGDSDRRPSIRGGAAAVAAAIFSPSVKIIRTGNTENQRVRATDGRTVDEIGEKEIEAKRRTTDGGEKTEREIAREMMDLERRKKALRLARVRPNSTFRHFCSR